MLDDDENLTLEQNKTQEPTNDRAALVPLTFDPTSYMHHLVDADLTEAQKAELLETIWQIMVHFVDLGIGISPIQQVLDKSANKESPLEAGFSDVLESSKTTVNNQKTKPRRAPKRQP
ncbi:hypothetical protein [Devosia sp. MC1541]|uniref:hypothetical protein n=1 Tax=Devosia sp. MC1541 TaxID=2725264 RepID=UPI00145F9B9D|nr:hypothetical protein [Devosia sp. MC1541]